VNERAATVLEFWFGDQPPEAKVPRQRLRFWFGGEEQSDRLIRERFAGDVEAAAEGRYDDWTATAHGSLALILLLDQFPRNIYRDSPRAYAADSKAVRVALAGLEAAQDRSLAPVQRAFFYLPLEHAEVLALQQRSVALFQALLKEAPPVLRSNCEGFLDYAVRHRDIIARFGRFPHRNATLGRPSTDEELEFLKQPGSSF